MSTKASKTSKTAAPMEGEEEDEEDLGALIFPKSQLRKAEAAAAAAKRKKSKPPLSSRRRTSTRKRPASRIDGILTKAATIKTPPKRMRPPSIMEEEDQARKNVGRDRRCRKIFLR
jgi:hypothetical protein